MRHRGRGKHYRQVTGDIQQAVILVGGRGTRLGELTQQTPKPLLPVAGRPFIEYWLAELAAVGITDIILACGHLAQHFIERYDRKKWQGAQIRCVSEDNPAGTGGALVLLNPLLAEKFFLLNGDSFMNINWESLAQCLGDNPHQRMGALSLIAPPKQKNRYGTVRQNDNGDIIGFAEKATTGRMINGGVYAFFSQVSQIADIPSSLEQDILPKLAAQGLLGGIVGDGAFIDIGIPEDYARAQTVIPAIAKNA